MNYRRRRLRILIPLTLLVLIGSPLPALADSAATNTMLANAQITKAIYENMQGMSAGLVNRNAEEIVGLFAQSPDVLVMGSKAGKIAHGIDEARAMFEGIVSAPAATRFEWKSYTVQALGDVAWLFALVDLIHERPEGVTRVPYRVTSVFCAHRGALAMGSIPRLGTDH